MQHSDNFSIKILKAVKTEETRSFINGRNINVIAIEENKELNGNNDLLSGFRSNELKLLNEVINTREKSIQNDISTNDIIDSISCYHRQHKEIINSWSSCPEVFCRKRDLRTFVKFTEKHLCQSKFL